MPAHKNTSSSARNQRNRDAERPRQGKSSPSERSNREAPAPPGERRSAPGIGVISSDRPASASKAGGRRAPGARRPGTTRSRPAAAHVAGSPDVAPGWNSRATEAATDGGGAPMSTGRSGEPESPSKVPMPELADPNYSAASELAISRPSTAPPRRRAGGRKVAEIMSTDLAVCEPGTEVYYVARMMAERDIGAIPVVDSTENMRPVGIITDRDIVVRIIAKRQDAGDLTAGDCMSTRLIAIDPQTTVKECVQLMERRRVRRVLVVDRRRLVGIVAQADVARSAPQPQAADLLREVSAPGHARR